MRMSHFSGQVDRSLAPEILIIYREGVSYQGIYEEFAAQNDGVVKRSVGQILFGFVGNAVGLENQKFSIVGVTLANRIVNQFVHGQNAVDAVDRNWPV